MTAVTTEVTIGTPVPTPIPTPTGTATWPRAKRPEARAIRPPASDMTVIEHRAAMRSLYVHSSPRSWGVGNGRARSGTDSPSKKR